MAKPTLESPFRNTKELQGRTYVPVHEVIDRLNCVLGIDGWSFDVTCWRDKADPDYVISKGRLTLHPSGAYREFYAGQQLNKKSNGDVIDLSDDFKGASSRALVKCASAFGVALYISLGHAPLPKTSEGDGSPTIDPSPSVPQSGEGDPASLATPSPDNLEDRAYRLAQQARSKEQRSAMPRNDG